MHFNPTSGQWLPNTSHWQRHINAAIDRYGIKGGMGPDEYRTAYPDAAAGIDNTAYPNVMVVWVLTGACDVIDLLPDMRRTQLCPRIRLSLDEIDGWYQIASKLRVPMNAEGIIGQFECYDELEELGWHHYREKYGDTPNRYKLSKQADVLMLFYLFSADEPALLFEQLGYPFDHDSIPKNVDYYLARISHGSALSPVAHSWVLARPDRPRSWHLFQQAFNSDIADIQGGATLVGIHVGAMAGSIDLIQRCYLSIEMRANVLHFDPALPDGLKWIKVWLHYRRHNLDLDLAPGNDCPFQLLKPEERNRDENRVTLYFSPAATTPKESLL